MAGASAALLAGRATRPRRRPRNRIPEERKCGTFGRAEPRRLPAGESRVNASLLVTCLGDVFFPEVGVATVRLLRRLGVEVDFPATQTCCG